MPAHRQAEVEEHRPHAEEGMDEDEGEQRRLDTAPERVHEVSRHDGEQDHGRRALDKPRPHADLRVAPAFGGRPLALEDAAQAAPPSRFTAIRPLAITSRTASSASIRSPGSPATAMRSAASPGAIRPVSS